VHHATAGKKAKLATRELKDEDPEFQIAPMIDILLVLLVFFMSISSTQVLQTNQNVRLPIAKDGKQRRPVEEGGVMIVNVLWNPLNNIGSIEVNDRPYAVAPDITPIIQNMVQKTPECRILIRADKDVKYDYLRSVLKAAGAGGVTNITFSVVDKE
jgi:biopolymer transport protein ExbD